MLVAADAAADASASPPAHLFVEVAAGGAHMVARTAAGDMLFWGRHPLTGAATHTPQRVDLPAECAPVVRLAAGAAFTLLVCEDGRVFGWGKGATGAGATDEAATPTPLVAVHAALGDDAANAAITQVSCAANGACVALAADGRVVAWAPSQAPVLVDVATASRATEEQVRARGAGDAALRVRAARVYAGVGRHFVALERAE